MKFQIINLPKIPDNRGNLSFAEELNHIPFKIERTYWIYDVPGGETRGGHAYRENEEFIIALSGSFDVVLDNGIQKQTFSLNRSYYGLYVPKGMWRQMLNFSTNLLKSSLSFVVSSVELLSMTIESSFSSPCTFLFFSLLWLHEKSIIKNMQNKKKNVFFITKKLPFSDFHKDTKKVDNQIVMYNIL